MSVSKANIPITLLYKKTLVIFLLDIVLFIAAFSVAQGGFPPDMRAKTSISQTPTRTRASILLHKASDENLHSTNVKINNLAFFNDSGRLFQTEKEIRAECHITQSRVEKPYDVVIKTDKKEILRKTIKPENSENSEQNFILNAAYMPSDTGLRPIACRADFDNTIEESDERDNRMVKYLMIFRGS